MKPILLYASLLILTSCAPTRYTPLCPPIVHYTVQEDKKAATELRSHPDLQKISEMLRDYGNERNELTTLCPNAPAHQSSVAPSDQH